MRIVCVFLTLAFYLSCLPRANADSLVLPITGGLFEYTVQPDDFLIKIGARFGVSAKVLARENSLIYDAKLMAGKKLVINNKHIVPELRKNGLLINLPQRMLYYFSNWELVAAYPVGLGKKNWKTPTGNFNVINKAVNKAWYVPKSIQEEMYREGKLVKTEVPPGLDNPLGKYWLGLSPMSVGIHGTIAPASIYHFQSHGCIRLHPNDIEALFPHIEYGTVVSIIYSPAMLTESEGEIFLEVHSDVYNKKDISFNALKELASNAHLNDDIDWLRAAEVLERKDGVARNVTLLKKQ